MKIANNNSVPFNPVFNTFLHKKYIWIKFNCVSKGMWMEFIRSSSSWEFIWYETKCVLGKLEFMMTFMTLMYRWDLQLFESFNVLLKINVFLLILYYIEIKDLMKQNIIYISLTTTWFIGQSCFFNFSLVACIEMLKYSDTIYLIDYTSYHINENSYDVVTPNFYSSILLLWSYHPYLTLI